MEKDQLNNAPLAYTGDAVARQDVVGETDWHVPPRSPNWAGRLAWLIAGFNIGFIVILLGLFGSTQVLAGFDIRRAESNNQEPPVTIIVPTEYVEVAALSSSTPEPTDSPTNLPPSATFIPSATPDLKATARGNNRLTQEAALGQTPEATATLTLTPTPIIFPTLTAPPPTSTSIPPPTSYYLDGISFYQQGWNNCGPANLAMGLSFYNWEGTQEDTASFLKPNREDKNVTPQQMVDYVTQYTNLNAIWRMAGSLEQLQWLTSHDFVVIVESGYEPRGEGWFGHYETVVGYDTNRRTVTVYDSYLGRTYTPTIVYGETQFDSQWQSFNRNYIVIYPPGRQQELINFLGSDWNEGENRIHAVQIAQAEAQANPSNEFIWFNLGTSLTAIGRYEEAVSAYSRAFELGLPYRMLWYQFNPYEAYLQTGRFEDVLSLANNTLKTTTFVEETYYFKGRVYEMQGNYASAKNEYQNALNFNPNYLQATIALTRVERY